MIEVDDRDYAAVVAALRAIDKDLEKNLSKRISAAAKPVVAEMRRQIKGTRSSVVDKDSSGAGFLSRSRGGSGATRRSAFATRGVTVNANEAVTTGKRLISRRDYDKRRMQARGVRDAIAAGVRLSNRKSGRFAGVTIRSSGSKLPPDQKTLPRAMNRGKWRHPVFGNRNNWVEQVVTPVKWFDDPGKKAKPSIYREVTVAVKETLAEAQRRGKTE